MLNGGIMKKILLKSVLALIIITIPVYNCINLFSSADTVTAAATDKSFVEIFSSFDVREIEKRISEKLEIRAQYYEQLKLEEEKRERYEKMKKQLEEGSLTYRQIFSDSLIVGDSLMNGLEIYKVLDSSNMITMVSASLYHLEGNISRIISNNPKNLILHYGINMMTNSQSQLDFFISMYTGIIKNLKSRLPDTEIYISGVFKVAESAADRYSYLDRYNEALQQMCESLEVNFVDNSECLPGDGSYYGSDGIHVSKSFYMDIWLPHLFASIYS